jgi:hypothetical protein
MNHATNTAHPNTMKADISSLRLEFMGSLRLSDKFAFPHTLPLEGWWKEMAHNYFHGVLKKPLSHCDGERSVA